MDQETLSIDRVVEFLISAGALGGFTPDKSRLLRDGSYRLTYIHSHSGDQTNLEIRQIKRYLRFSTQVPVVDVGDHSDQLVERVYEANLAPYLAGLRVDAKDQVMCEAALLLDHAEVQEVVQTVKSALVLWRIATHFLLRF